MKRLIIGLTLAALLFGSMLLFYGCEKSPENKVKTVKSSDSTIIKKNEGHLRQGELTFFDDAGNEITRIVIEIAADDYSRSFGLMFREKLPFSQGMLFIFDDDDVRYFWMKNTPLPLDMIFVNKDKKIVKIQKNTKPFSLQSYSSESPARYVVEVNTGFSDSFQIKEGDKIEWKIYGNE